MEYRRTKRRRGASSGRSGAGRAVHTANSGAARMIAALIVIAAIVYVVSASAIGTWIAEKIIAPAFSAFDNLTQATNPSTPAPAADSGSVMLPQEGDADSNSVTGEVELPAMECFALQMGVFSDQSNANKEAQALQQRGAGGYVMEDAGKYRVFAAVYLTQENLKQVRTQLEAEGLESASYVFSAPANTLRVTAPQEQLDGIVAGVNALTALLENMAAQTLQFDQQQMSVDEGRKIATELLMRLRQAKEAFEIAATVQHPILDATKECFQECEEALLALSEYNTQNFVDFSAQMKYTNICVVHAYTKLADRVSSL